ncbi:Ger(x)C family spore germination protein [Virgibacillus siamensis]|uniref:Ger(x)C family spore germination protein n=1 Tax=Virgibacillus siamensis TaxID=480071 RepID=UPI000985EDDD|nr:Ger(x)C family spore germination protein [Virgibacillus siamensis]
MKNHKRVCLVFSSILFFLLAGCWDRVEIEERGFVLGAAIDVAEEQTGDELQLRLTTQLVVPSGIGTPASGSSSSKEPYMNISATGHSMYTINRKLAEQTSRSPYYQHVKLLVVSEEVAANPNLFSSLMDFFIRDHEMRRGIRVLIAQDEAKKVLEATSDTEDLPTIYIESMLENSYKNGDVLQPLRLGKIHEYLVSDQSFAIPKIHMKGDRAVYQNAAVFHDFKNKVIGTLESKDIKGLNFITGKMEGGLIKVELNEHLTTLEILRIHSNMHITAINENSVEAKVKVNVNAKVAETFSSMDIATEKNLNKLEKGAEKKVKKLILQTAEKSQNELDADVLGLGQLLKHHYYDYWKQVRTNWDQGRSIFANSDITAEVHVAIRGTGGADQTSIRGE